MARPRVFISSTFYDLRQIREDLELAIRELGFEAVRNETGSIPYPKGDKLETSAYREVELCDIIVCVIGGRFGTESKDQPGYSITQSELRRALEKGIQVFIFIEKSVMAEFSTYELNKDNTSVKYKFVDDTRVFAFIEEINKLPRNNPTAAFERSSEIASYLRDQFAGLFHRFLQDDKRKTEYQSLHEIASLAKTLRDLVTFLAEEKSKGSDAIHKILLTHNPIFRRLKNLLKIPYRVYFENRTEMEQLLRARSWTEVDEKHWDAGSTDEWSDQKKETYLRFSHEVFDAEGNLIGFDPTQWKDKWIELLPIPPEASPGSVSG